MLSQKLINVEKQKIKFNDNPPRKDLTNKIFGRLTVLGRAEDYISPKGKKSSQWWCICDCPQHNIIKVRITNLTSGNTKSCGCLNNEKRTERIKKIGSACAKDLTNQQFNELIAIKPTTKRNNGSVVWECKCSCGKIHYVSAHDLTNNRISSCGHNKESKGVKKIKEILNNNNIPFTTEKTFLDCRFPDSNAYARFDFYINNQFLLEYDGEQHFKELDKKFFKDTLKKRQEHDKYKNQWCKEHNIPLVRIPYYELNNINLEMIMGDEYII